MHASGTGATHFCNEGIKKQGKLTKAPDGRGMEEGFDPCLQSFLERKRGAMPGDGWA